MVELLLIVIVAALIFDFINGFHDAANAIATSVATGVLPLRTAVIMAGIFNFAGALAGTAVAKTIATGFVDPAQVGQQFLLATLIGASTWNLLTWWWGIPSSSSHALIGGLAGAAVAAIGWGGFHWHLLVEKVVIPLVVSPILGFVLAFLLLILFIWLVRRMRPATVRRQSRRAQLVSACAMAFSHGSNDAQKIMGIILLALLSYVHAGGTLGAWTTPGPDGHGGWQIPLWVVIACATAIATGTMIGGKRIIKTMGNKIVRITPLQGFAAETAGAVTILGASHLGIPVSTTHCISACVMGVGAGKRLSAVRWGLAGRILIAWVLTIPASAAVAWLAWFPVKWLFPT